MPIVTIQFNLPEENYEYKTATQAAAMSAALYEIASEYRKVLKHQDEHVSAVWYEGFEKASDIFWRTLQGEGLDPYGN